VIATKPDALYSLAGRLTEEQDRETYAALISYVNSLPPGDELFKVVQLLGLLSLLGQRLPDALAEFLAELRAQTKAAGSYHNKLDERLASLPNEIAQGVDPSAIAKAMSESFRQQLAACGLQDAAILLNASVKDIKALSAQIASALKPVGQEYRGISASISAELGKIAAASRQLQEHNTTLIFQGRANAWLWKGLLGLVLFLVGGICGILVEKHQIAGFLGNIGSHIEAVQTPDGPIVALPKQDRKQGAL
jgi:hypothetical protein